MQLNLYVTLAESKENPVHKLLPIEMVLLFMVFSLKTPETKLEFSIDFSIELLPIVMILYSCQKIVG